MTIILHGIDNIMKMSVFLLMYLVAGINVAQEKMESGLSPCDQPGYITT